MRYFLDTEFFENGSDRPIQLISIGLVSGDGREYYAEVEETDLSTVSDWLKQNVVPHLTGPRKPRKAIAAEIREFVGLDPEPMFWGYFADYDWVLFCQLFGRMIDLPHRWPMFCRDVKQLAYHMGVSKASFPKQTSTEHHALEDARWTRDVFTTLYTKLSPGIMGELPLAQLVV